MKRTLYTILLVLLAGCIVRPMTAQEAKRLTVEAPSPDPTLVVRGPEMAVSGVDDAGWTQAGNALYLFTSAFGPAVSSPQTTLVALQVDASMRVKTVVNGEVNRGVRPAFTQALDLPIEQGGFVLVATDDSYDNRGLKRFLAENFRRGDLVRLRLDGEPTSLASVVSLAAAQAAPSLMLDGDPLRTVVGSEGRITGRVANVAALPADAELLLIGPTGEARPLTIGPDGGFEATAELRPHTNYLTLALHSSGRELATEPLTIYSKQSDGSRPEVVMWVEQFPNALTLTSDSAVDAMVRKSLLAGFTSIGIDVKGPEGYVSYRNSELSHSPYLTASVNPKKQVPDNGFDLLASVLRSAHEAGMKVYTSFNFFTEGNITASDYAVLNLHPEWEEQVQRPEDCGAILPVRKSRHGLDAAAGKKIALAFVNPSNREVQDFQLLRVEEVLRHYDVDGIVLDRCRYDNLYADFSPLTAEAFADWLAGRGERLEAFPADAFVIDADGNMQKGRLYKEWITFRSHTIKQFAGRVRALVDRYKSLKNPDLKMAAYVGSWYEVYYQNGVNWASPEFVYDERLRFPESELYGEAYSATSFLDNLDFLMIGTYYKTAREVNRYITLGNILTCGRLPLLGSMSLPDLQPDEQTDLFRASLTSSAGLMIFDHCYIRWEEFIKNMQDAISAITYEYEN